MPDPRQLDRHLSACGWTFSPDEFSWRKGAAAISVEALEDFAFTHGWALPWLERALRAGATGFKVVVEEGEKHSLTFRLTFEFE